MTHPSPRGALERWVGLCARRPLAALSLTLALAAAAVALALTLRVNTNQLEMISAASRQVRDIHRVTDMIGGAGHLTVALRGARPEALKAAAVDLAEHLTRDEGARVRDASYQLPTAFLLERAALFMETADLEELRRRVNAKLADAKRRADPFFFELEPTPPVALKVDDLLSKYGRVGKKRVSDDFYLSVGDDASATPGAMVLVQVKPRWDSNELERTGALVADLRAWLAARALPLGGAGEALRFVEDYSPAPPSDPLVVEFGFTGTYQTNYDDSFQIKDSLAPVSVWAFVGVLLTLLLFFGRHLFAVALVVSGLLLGLAVTFGWAALTIGELNMITSILGGILMGLGIDFGIHLLYRLREELARHARLEDALAVTLRGAGVASLVSGLGTAAAFASLMLSEFKGFSQFGFLAGSGVFLIGAVMYVWVPAVVMWVERGAPGRARRWLGAAAAGAAGGAPPPARALPRAGLIAALSGGLALALSALAPRAPFEYNTRALMVEGVASVRLQDEVAARFALGADPVAIYTPTREAAREVFEHLRARLPSAAPAEGVAPLDTLDQVVGLDSFLPPAAQQARNAAVLAAWRAELAAVDPARLPEEVRARWAEVQRALNAAPFTLADLPAVYREPFESLPTARPENAGFLTFVYAGVDLWDGLSMLRFAAQVEEVRVASGVYHAAGMPILFSQLTQMILRDGQLTALWTTLLLVLILAIDLRRPRDVLAALAPLLLGVGSMLGVMSLIGAHLNLMNIVVFPIIIGYGVSHGVYLLHRVREGATPRDALSSVGSAVACSTLTTLAGWAALLAAPHKGLQSMGTLACVGMLASLLVSFTLMPALLELARRRALRRAAAPLPALLAALLVALLALALSGCGGARERLLADSYEQRERTALVRVEVRASPRLTAEVLADGALGPERAAPVPAAVVEMWALMAQRYLNDHRDFLALRRAALPAPLTPAAAARAPACGEGAHGVLHIDGEVSREGGAARVRLWARLSRCLPADGAAPRWAAGGGDELVWAADVDHASESADEVLVTLREDYARRLGDEVAPYAAPSFLALKDLLDLAPRPKLTREEDVNDKIELEY